MLTWNFSLKLIRFTIVIGICVLNQSQGNICITASFYCIIYLLYEIITHSSRIFFQQELKETEELDIQLKVFNENKEEDSIELSHRLDDIRAEMEYPFYRCLAHAHDHGAPAAAFLADPRV